MPINGLRTIKQQVMSRTTLWKVVEQFNLYQEERKSSPTEEIVKRFIKDIEVEVISADVVDKRTQHGDQGDHCLYGHLPKSIPGISPAGGQRADEFVPG